MNAVQCPEPIPEGASIVNGIVYYREDEDDYGVTSPDILSRFPDCLAMSLHEEYECLYEKHGEEKAEAFLHKISNELTSDTLSLDASDEEIRPYARKLADQFLRLQRWFKNPVNAVLVLCAIAHNKYGVTPPWTNKDNGKVSLSVAAPVKKPVAASIQATGQNVRPVPVTVSGIGEPVLVTGAHPQPVPVTGESTFAMASVHAFEPVTVTGPNLPSFPVTVTGRHNSFIPVTGKPNSLIPVTGIMDGLLIL